MFDDVGFVEGLTLMDEYSTLVPVSEIPNKTAAFYYEKANALNKYCKHENLADPAIDQFPLFREWCVYIKRFSTCNIAPHPSEFITSLNGIVEKVSSLLPFPDNAKNITLSQNVTKNRTSCYDDFYCESSDQARLHYLVYGAVFALICTAGLFLNVACLVGFNKSSNRSGATLYFSVIAILDCIYLGIQMTMRASYHLADSDYAGQKMAYAQKVASFIPFTIPLQIFCELSSVWLILCVLVDRYLYLQRGYFSKSVTSLNRHIRLTTLVVVFSMCYTIPRFFEFKAVRNPDILEGYRVVLTDVGNSTLYRNLTDYLLNIPIEMFLPYLAIGIVTSLAVSKMVDFGSSKWKAVASVCSPSRYGCCGDDFANCYPSSKQNADDTQDHTSPSHKLPPKQFSPSSTDMIDGMPNSFTTLPRMGTLDDTGKGQVFYCGIPFEKRSDLMPFYFLVPPPRKKLQETANVVIAVCLGFLLLLTKIPKLVLIALELERYVDLDPVLLRMSHEILGLAFIILKPPIYLLLGVHFRHALTGLFCCACLYSPVIRGSPSSQEAGGAEADEEYNPVVGDERQQSSAVWPVASYVDSSGVGGRGVKRRGNSLPSTENAAVRRVYSQPGYSGGFTRTGSSRKP